MLRLHALLGRRDGVGADAARGISPARWGSPLPQSAGIDPLTEALETLALKPVRQNIAVRLVALA